MKVSAKKGDGTPVEIEKDFGENLDDMIELYGDSVVFDKARSAMVVALQGVIRTHEGKSAKQIQDIADAWQPGTRKAGKSKAEKIRDAFKDLDAEQRAEILKDLKA